MDCLKGKISYRYCAGPDSKGVLYINDLPGLSTLLLNDLATVEKESFDKVFASIETRVLRSFQSKIEAAQQTEFNTTYQLYENPQYQLLQPVAFALQSGPVYQIFQVPTGRYTTALFKKVEFYSNTALNEVAISIIDLFTGVEVKTVTHNVTVGYNRVELDFSPDNPFALNYYAIKLNATGLQLAPFVFNDGSCFDCCNDLMQYPATITGSPLFDNVTASGKQFLAADFSYYCDVSKYVCANSSVFLSGLWYQFGAEILKEALNSDRVTWAVKGNTTQKELNMTDLEDKATKEIASAIKKIPFGSLCADCFGKNGNYSVASILP